MRSDRRARKVGTVYPGKGELAAFFKKNYETDKTFPPDTIDSASRASSVLGNLLHDLFGNYPVLSGWWKRVKSLSLWFSGLLYMAGGNIIANSLIGGFYIGSLLLLAAGIFVAGWWQLGLLGLVGIALTSSIHVGVLKVRVLFRDRVKWYDRFVFNFLLPVLLALPGFAAGILILFLLYLGLVKIGLPEPGGAIGEWIQTVSGWLNLLMTKINALFTAK